MMYVMHVTAAEAMAESSIDGDVPRCGITKQTPERYVIRVSDVN